MFGYKNGRLHVFDADKGGSGAGGEGDAGGKALSEDELIKKASALIARNGGSPESVVGILMGETFTLREANRRLAADLEAAKKRTPAEGSVVLGADDAAAWAAYQAFGKPDKVKALLEQHGQFQGELTTLRRDVLIRDVADATGAKYSVLRTLDRPELAYEIKDDNGKKTVMIKNGDGDATEFSVYANAQWADFLSSLMATTRGVQGTPFVRQDGGNKGATEPNLRDEIVQSMNNRIVPKGKNNGKNG